MKNGELLKRVQEQFDVFVTVDRNLPFQRDLSVFSIAVVVLRTQANRLDDETSQSLVSGRTGNSFWFEFD